MRALTEECVAAASEPWRARHGPAARGRIRLFRSFVPEHLVFRGHPALPYLLVTPIVGHFLDRHAAAPAHGAAASVAVFVAGAIAWTLLEYAMHRFLFHPRARSLAGRAFAFVLHGHHHVTPAEPSRLAATPVQILSLALLVGGLWRLALPSGWMLAMAGTLCGYLAYEAVHHLAHHGPANDRLVRALTRHHLRHHYERPEACWGISSPLWDWIFRSS